MSTSTTGYNDAAAIAAAEQIVSGGATVHLFGNGDTLNYTDGATEVSNKSDASVSLAQADTNVSAASGFAGVTTLENTVQLNFGSQSIGVVDQIVIQNDTNTDQLLLIDEPNDPDLTGEDVTLPANSTLYEFGNP
jgi:hypothetical protein